jgi:CDP-glycerol glycerophosphotransferase (TagB/SpsB family)
MKQKTFVNFKKICKKVSNIFVNILVIFVSLFIPKTKKIWLVGGWFGYRFSDNSKFFYLYANKIKRKYGIEKVVWITRSKKIQIELAEQGLESYYIWSFKSLWYHFRAKVHIIDQSPHDINGFLSFNSFRLNLWHGFPLKKIGSFVNSSEEKEDSHRNYGYKSKFKKVIKVIFSPGFWEKKYLLATSEFAANIFSKAFDTPKNRIIVSGYPRNYSAIFNNTNQDNFISVYDRERINFLIDQKKDGKKIISYFPTFRDGKSTYLFGTNNKKEIKNLIEFLKSNNIIILIKHHFAEEDASSDYIKNDGVFINLESDTDIYSYLELTDVLMTDYSSIFFDFLLWKKPIIFFPYDLNFYSSSDRGLLFDYYEFTPGPKVFNISEFQDLLQDGIEDFKKSYSLKYKHHADVLSEQIFEVQKKKDIEHLINSIFRIIKK